MSTNLLLESLETNDLTLGWQNSDPLSHPKCNNSATIARQASASGELLAESLYIYPDKIILLETVWLRHHHIDSGVRFSSSVTPQSDNTLPGEYSAASSQRLSLFN